MALSNNKEYTMRFPLISQHAAIIVMLFTGAIFQKCVSEDQETTSTFLDTNLDIQQFMTQGEAEERWTSTIFLETNLGIKQFTVQGKNISTWRAPGEYSWHVTGPMQESDVLAIGRARALKIDPFATRGGQGGDVFLDIMLNIFNVEPKNFDAYVIDSQNVGTVGDLFDAQQNPDLDGLTTSVYILDLCDVEDATRGIPVTLRVLRLSAVYVVCPFDDFVIPVERIRYTLFLFLEWTGSRY